MYFKKIRKVEKKIIIRRVCKFTNPTNIINFKEKLNYFREHECRVVDAKHPCLIRTQPNPGRFRGEIISRNKA